MTVAAVPVVADHRIMRLQHAGVWYLPIVARTGRILDLPAARALADARRDGAMRPRYVSFVLADASTPSHGQPPLHCARFRTCGALPLELGDSALTVGVVEAIWVALPGATPGTVGAHLLARARLSDSVLADVVWRGLQAGVLSGVCAVAGPGDADETEFHAVRLGDLESSCLAGARVLRYWEEDAAP